MRALLTPTNARHKPVEVELLARVGNNKIQVSITDEEAKRTAIFAVERWRLNETVKQHGKARERIAERDLDKLPWKGAGDDPLAIFAEAATAE